MSAISRRLAFISQLLASDQVALSSGSLQLSYAELCSEVRRCSEWLSDFNGSLVALHAENSIDWVIADLACQEAGLPCVPLPTFFSPDQIKQCLLNSGADIVLSDQAAFREHLSFAELDGVHLIDKGQYASLLGWQLCGVKPGNMPEHTQKITFTSGSTGKPKGVCLSADQQWQVAQSLADIIGIPNPKHLCLLPLSTLLENIAGVYSPLLCGGTVFLASDAERGMQGSSRLDTQALLACISKTQPTTMILIPQLLTVLVAACEKGWQPPGSLAFVAVGGGKTSPHLLKKAHEYGLPVFQGYGLSECGSVVALNTIESNAFDSVGRVLAHCAVTIENAEVVVTGGSYLGYLDEPDSWYPKRVHTGDTGSLQDGFLTINGRKKNILITSYGRNVSPEWVESLLMSTPLLSQCLVVGDGMSVLCALVAAPEAIDNDTIEVLVCRVNDGLPDYARIARWSRLDEMCLASYITTNGRLQRSRVEAAFADVIERLYSTEPPLKMVN